MLKNSHYAPPYPLENLPKHLHNDPVHRWRAESGVELLHQEPTFKELKRIINNWNLMTPEQKKISDKMSMQLFGKSNKDRINELLQKWKK